MATNIAVYAIMRYLKLPANVKSNLYILIISLLYEIYNYRIQILPHASYL